MKEQPMKQGELKPCPFCGGGAHYWPDAKGRRTHIACCPDPNCGGSDFGESAEKWNRRAPQSVSAEAGEPDLVSYWRDVPMACPLGLEGADRKVVLDYIDALRERLAEARALLREWMDTELDPEDETYAPWLDSFMDRVAGALKGGET